MTTIPTPAFGSLLAVAPDALATHIERRMAFLSTHEAKAKEDPKPYPVTSGVAEIMIEGPLLQRGLEFWGFVWWDGYDLIAVRIMEALDDKSVDCLLIRFDSPGGDVAGCFEATRALRSAIIASGKKVYVIVDEFCASAAYALACCLSTEGIFLTREAMAGSIGVVCRHVDQSKMLELRGIKVTEITDPEGKTAGFSPYKPLDEEGESRLREQVETYAETFIDHVATSRGMTPKAIRSMNAKMFIGAKAVEEKLCDGVASCSEVFARAIGSARNAQEARMSKQTLAVVLGVAEGASPEQIEAAVMQHRSLVGLGKEALRLTGQTDPEAAKGVLLAHSEAAAKLPAVQKSLAELQSSHDGSERIKLCEEAVRRGIAPALVWKDGDKAKGVSEWAGPPQMLNGEAVGQSLAQLRAYVGAHQPVGVVATRYEPNQAEGAARAAGVSLKDVEAYAAAHNVQPIAVAMAAQIVGG